jgi:uncharacterized coiled-coil protein SlyX
MILYVILFIIIVVSIYVWYSKKKASEILVLEQNALVAQLATASNKEELLARINELNLLINKKNITIDDLNLAYDEKVKILRDILEERNVLISQLDETAANKEELLARITRFNILIGERDLAISDLDLKYNEKLKLLNACSTERNSLIAQLNESPNKTELLARINELDILIGEKDSTIDTCSSNLISSKTELEKVTAMFYDMLEQMKAQKERADQASRDLYYANQKITTHRSTIAEQIAIIEAQKITIATLDAEVIKITKMFYDMLEQMKAQKVIADDYKRKLYLLNQQYTSCKSQLNTCLN